MMDALAIDAAEAAVHPNFPPADTVLIVELDGPAAEVRELFAIVEAICRAHRRDDRRGRARPTSSATRIWKGRKAAFAAMGRVSPNYYVQDGVVPRTRLPEVLGRIRALSKRDRGCGIGNVFHAGDGNLHPLICYDERDSRPGGAGRGGRRRDPHLLRRGRRLDHRRARRRRRQEGVHAADVLGRRPRRDAAGARRVRSAAALQSRQGVADAAAVRRGARSRIARIRSSRPAWPSGSDGDAPCSPAGPPTPSTASCRGTVAEPDAPRSLPRRWRERRASGCDGDSRRRHQARLGPRRRGASISIVSTARLEPTARRIAHGDLTATVAGRARRCADVNAALARQGQWLPVESAFDDAPRSAAWSRPTTAGRCATATARRAIC